jgi:hypothetical protein
MKALGLLCIVPAFISPEEDIQSQGFRKEKRKGEKKREKKKEETLKKQIT